MLEAAPAASPNAPLAPVPIKSNTLMTWTAAVSGGPVVYGAERILVHLQPRGRRAAIRITGPGGHAITLYAVAASGVPRVNFGVGHIDPASGAAQVVLTGAAGNRLVEFLGGHWRVVDLGDWTGDRGYPTLRGADGCGVLEYHDDRLAAFGAAGARAPPLIKTVRGGRLIDVSAESSVRPVFEAAMRRLGPDCEKGDNGACAAYVASAARLGQTDSAWRFMMSHARAGGALPTACRRSEPGAGGCPASETVTFASYPEALRWYLGATGYLSPTSLPRRET